MNSGVKKFELKTERLFLRLLQKEDVPEIFRIARKNPEITKFMSWDPPKKIEETQAFFDEGKKEFKKGKLVRWGIFLEKEFCGIVGLEGVTRQQRAWKFDKAELGYWLALKFQGQGFMTEATRVVLQFGFEKLALHKIMAGAVSENITSQRVIEKLGFRFIGVRKEHFFRHGKWWDHKVYELLAKDFIT